MANRTPTHVVFLFPARGSDHSWKSVGSAWANKDGSINLVFNGSVAKGARLQLRRRKQSLEALAAQRIAELEAARSGRASTPASPATRDAERMTDTPSATTSAKPRGGGVHVW